MTDHIIHILGLPTQLTIEVEPVIGNTIVVCCTPSNLGLEAISLGAIAYGCTFYALLKAEKEFNDRTIWNLKDHALQPHLLATATDRSVN